MTRSDPGCATMHRHQSLDLNELSCFEVRRQHCSHFLLYVLLQDGLVVPWEYFPTFSTVPINIHHVPESTLSAHCMGRFSLHTSLSEVITDVYFNWMLVPKQCLLPGSTLNILVRNRVVLYLLLVTSSADRLTPFKACEVGEKWRN